MVFGTIPSAASHIFTTGWYGVMKEEQVQDLNEMIDTVFARLKLDIKNAPAEHLPFITQSLLMFKDYSNAMQNAAMNQQGQEQLMRTLRKQIEGGNFGIGGLSPDMFGFPPNGTPPAGPPPAPHQ